MVVSSEREAKQLAECEHVAALPFGEIVKRCPHCGAMQVRGGPWALPHLVDQFVRAWRKSRKGPS